MKKQKNDDIYENRFLVWLIFLLPIACTGWVGICIWTGIQLAMLSDERETRKRINTPIRERAHIKEMNDPKNLTEEEKEYLRICPEMVKIGEGMYCYDKKKK